MSVLMEYIVSILSYPIVIDGFTFRLYYPIGFACIASIIMKFIYGKDRPM